MRCGCGRSRSWSAFRLVACSPTWPWMASTRWGQPWWRAWIPGTGVGLAVGLTAGAALVDYGISRGDLLLMGAVTGLCVGVLQALVLMQAGNRPAEAVWWVVANPIGWAVAWFVSSYVIARNIGERWPVFGASGCVVFGLVTWPLIAALFNRASESHRTGGDVAR